MEQKFINHIGGNRYLLLEDLIKKINKLTVYGSVYPNKTR